MKSFKAKAITMLCTSVIVISGPVTPVMADEIQGGGTYFTDGRAGNIESYGVLSGVGSNGEGILLDSGDMVRLAEGLDEIPNYLSDACSEAYSYGLNDIHEDGSYLSVECQHHVHYGMDAKQPDGKIFYQHENPGGCFVTAGHTHDKTGSCPACTHWYTPMVGCGGSMNIISWHDYGTFKAKQYQCSYCGHIQRLEWSAESPEPNGPGSCGNQIPGEPLQSHDRDCAHEVNTWKIGCGCTRATRESLDLVLLDNLVPVPEIKSHGVYGAGDDILLNSGDIHRMQLQFYDALAGCNAKIVNQFLAGARGRANPGKPNFNTSYAYHEHDAACQDDNKIFTCGKTESTIESVSLEFY